MLRVCAVLKAGDGRDPDSISINIEDEAMWRLRELARQGKLAGPGIEPDYVIRFHRGEGYEILMSRRSRRTGNFNATAHIDDPAEKQFIELLKVDLTEPELEVIIIE